MKNKSEKIFATAAAITAGGALGILFVRLSHKSGIKNPEDVSCRERERLVFVKNKLEKHRERLDRHLRHINARIEAAGVGKTATD